MSTLYFVSILCPCYVCLTFRLIQPVCASVVTMFVGEGWRKGMKKVLVQSKARPLPIHVYRKLLMETTGPVATQASQQLSDDSQVCVYTYVCTYITTKTHIKGCWGEVTFLLHCSWTRKFLTTIFNESAAAYLLKHPKLLHILRFKLRP